jgi:HEAT repeat protein
MTADPRIQKLIRRLQSPDEMVRLKAGWLLGRMGLAAKEAVPALVELLQSGTVPEKKQAAFTLGCMGGAAVEAVPALTQALQDPNESVRNLADSALEKMRSLGEKAAA